MNGIKPIFAACLALAVNLSCAAQQNGYWRAASTNAAAITSDIGISDRSITINYVVFPMAQIRKLNSAEVSSVFDVDLTAAGIGTLYRLNISAEKRFIHKNTLCGTEDTQWMATYLSGKTLDVAFFSGSDTPIFTFDAMAKSTDLCGTFTYVR